MWGPLDHQPGILLLAAPPVARALRQHLVLITTGPLAVAATVPEAEAQLRRNAWDIFVIDGHFPGLARPLPPNAFAGSPGVLLLDDVQPETAVDSMQGSAPVWLPRHLVLEHPMLLDAGLDQALGMADLARRLTRTQGHLRESQTQLETMLRLLGTTGNAPGGPRWHSHRAMLERLTEEVARVARHGGTLSVVLAEVAQPEPRPGTLVWVAEHLSQRKRGCDAIGQYGPQGFMMVLPQTETPGARECCTRLAALLAEADPARAGSAWRLDYGVAGYLQPHTSARSLLCLAEEELERSRGSATR